jgi:transcriptional regulator with XRE-family HTH domain
MYEINERIKELRKALDLSQTEFGEALHVSRGVINNIDRNLVEPKPLFLDSIISTFNVNPEWLLDGDGEMFREMSHNEKVAAFIGEALADEPEAFRRRFIELAADFTAEDWLAVERVAQLTAKLFTPPDE